MHTWHGMRCAARAAPIVAGSSSSPALPRAALPRAALQASDSPAAKQLLQLAALINQTVGDAISGLLAVELILRCGRAHACTHMHMRVHMRAHGHTL